MNSTIRMVAIAMAIFSHFDATSAFVVRTPSFSRSCLGAAPVPVPPPEKAIIAASSSASQQPSTGSSSLPTQKDLADMSKTSSAKTAPPKSTNVASGAGFTISDIHYNGDVPTTEADEYVVLSNNLKNSLDVSGYCVYVATSGSQGATFTFPKGSMISPSKTVRVYTNEIHKESGGYSYGSGKAIWNNKGGLAVLKDSNGKKLMEYKYKPSS